MDINRVLWAAMLSSLGALFVVTQVLPAGTHKDPDTLNLVLPILGVADVGLSFLLPAFLPAVQGMSEAARRQRLVLSLALCEAAALVGLVLHLVTGWPYSPVLFAAAAAGMVAHFPRS